MKPREVKIQVWRVCVHKDTGAGFEVDRRGVAAITSEGPAVEVLWAASTRERYAIDCGILSWNRREQ